MWNSKRDILRVCVGKVSGGLPPFAVPAFTMGNKTFPEIVKDMGSAVIAVPMISIMETIAIGKAFGTEP